MDARTCQEGYAAPTIQRTRSRTMVEGKVTVRCAAVDPKRWREGQRETQSVGSDQRRDGAVFVGLR